MRKDSRAQSDKARSAGIGRARSCEGQAAHGATLMTRTKERPVNSVLEAHRAVAHLSSLISHTKATVRPKIGHTGSVAHRDNGRPSRTQPGGVMPPDDALLIKFWFSDAFDAAFVLSIPFCRGHSARAAFHTRHVPGLLISRRRTIYRVLLLCTIICSTICSPPSPVIPRFCAFDSLELP